LASVDPSTARVTQCPGVQQAGTKVLWPFPHHGENWRCGVHVHDVFHVGLLKQFKGEPLVDTPTLPPIRHGQPVQSQGRCGAVGWHGDVAKCWCNGRVYHRPRQHGQPWRNFRNSTPNSSSRTSCWQRGERCHGRQAVC
jgi:hypothetical protein